MMKIPISIVVFLYLFTSQAVADVTITIHEPDFSNSTPIQIIKAEAHYDNIEFEEITFLFSDGNEISNQNVGFHKNQNNPNEMYMAVYWISEETYIIDILSIKSAYDYGKLTIYNVNNIPKNLSTQPPDPDPIVGSWNVVNSVEIRSGKDKTIYSLYQDFYFWYIDEVHFNTNMTGEFITYEDFGDKISSIRKFSWIKREVEAVPFYGREQYQIIQSRGNPIQMYIIHHDQNMLLIDFSYGGETGSIKSDSKEIVVLKRK